MEFVSQISRSMFELGNCGHMSDARAMGSPSSLTLCGPSELANKPRRRETELQRIAKLQSPALYICSDKILNETEIAGLQCVGSSAKRTDFRSTRRYGVGLQMMMYRFCDCPQLLANGRLDFFDLLRSQVPCEGVQKSNQKNSQQGSLMTLGLSPESPKHIKQMTSVSLYIIVPIYNKLDTYVF